MNDKCEAIAWLANIKEKYIHGGDEEFDECRRESIDMAIKALRQPQIVRCKDCKHFGIKDYWMDYGGVPILAASDCPTCNKWADGCKTKPDGYCFMAERRD